jgi:hypothetical protein
MNAEDIIEIVEKEYSSCPNMISKDGKLYCYTWWRHDDCVRIMNLLHKITNDSKYTLPEKI